MKRLFLALLCGAGFSLALDCASAPAQFFRMPESSVTASDGLIPAFPAEVPAARAVATKRGHIQVAVLRGITGSGGGGAGTCAPVGSAGQLLTDNGALGCSSNTTGTGVLTALGINTGSAGAVVLFNGALGTPSSGVGTNITNVNAATLGGATFAAPGAIGGGTPAAITGTVITGNSFVPNLSTIPTNGMYLSAANTPAIAANSTKVVHCVSTGCTVTGTLDITGNVTAANLATLSGSLTDGGAIYTDGTNVKSGAALVSNSVVLGGGAAGSGPKTVAGMTTNGAGGLVLGVNTTTLGSVKMFGNTSGDVTISPPAVAGTATALTTPTASGSLMVVLASGTAAMATGAISSAACATVVTPSATAGSLTGIATTDVIIWTSNADPSALTGYGKATTDGLKVYAYPTTNTVNFLVCNASGNSITPSAITFNWKAVR